MSDREQAVQLIKKMPEAELHNVLIYMKELVISRKSPAKTAASAVIDDLKKAEERAESEGWISELDFFQKYEAFE